MNATWNNSFELDLEADARRRLHRAWLLSAVGHGLVVLLLSLRPAPDPFVLPAAITVNLISAPPSPAPPAARPAPAAKPAPAPKPAPVPPPPPQAKILPKQAPEVVARPAPVPKPAPAEPVPRPVRPKEMELGDAMAALRSEVGEDSPLQPPPAETLARAEVAPNAMPGAASQTGSAVVSPELRLWMAATARHVQSVWVNPVEFLGRGLLTELEVTLEADGTVVGRPRVLRSSGDPYADDNAVRALQKASPLPAPPSAGRHVFIFSPEATSR